MISKNEVIKYLKSYKQKHPKDYHLIKLGLFGSVARDENSQESDLDIVVEFSQQNLFILSGIKEDSKEQFNTDIDVIINPKHIKQINKDVVYV